jgi:HEAT repeat protein
VTPGTGSSPGPVGAGPVAGPRNPSTGGGGVQAGPDLTKWQFWWEFNKDPFINLKAAIHGKGPVTDSDDFIMGAGKMRRGKDSMKPTEHTIRNRVLPKLQQAMEASNDKDITSSCLIAMAKIGMDHEDFRILDLFREKLSSGDQEIRETAAISMGITQMPEALTDLTDLVLDNARGRRLADSGEVNDRTRSFAAYGLGLVANATSDVQIKSAAFDALEQILVDESIVNRNPRVAAINGIAQLNIEPIDEKSVELLGSALEALEKYFVKDLGRGEELIQSHVPPAIAKLLSGIANEGGFALRKQVYKRNLLIELEGKSRRGRRGNEIIQSTVLALGQLAMPYEDEGSDDAEISKALESYFAKGKDQQAKYFALLALGQIGGKENRSALLRALEKGNKALEKPWAALGLGVYSFQKAEEDPEAVADPVIGRALQNWLGRLKNPDARGAIAVALGLARFDDAADDLRAMLLEEKNQEELAGYLCIGLALMDDQNSKEIIENIVRTSSRRPDRLRQAAIALGKLGDKKVTNLLQDMMKDGSQNLAKMSAIASALGFIGDHRSINDLLDMLFDESLTPLTRAFAAVALGGVSDKELLPWNSKIAVNMNYRAAVETLTDRQAGVLDIL